jgi:hypothetical protein
MGEHRTIPTHPTKIVAFAREVAALAKLLGATRVEGATEAQEQALVEATADLARAAVILDRWFGGDRG